MQRSCTVAIVAIIGPLTKLHLDFFLILVAAAATHKHHQFFPVCAAASNNGLSHLFIQAARIILDLTVAIQSKRVVFRRGCVTNEEGFRLVNLGAGRVHQHRSGQRVRVTGTEERGVRWSRFRKS